MSESVDIAETLELDEQVNDCRSRAATGHCTPMASLRSLLARSVGIATHIRAQSPSAKFLLSFVPWRAIQ